MSEKANRFLDSDDFLNRDLEFLERNETKIGTEKFDARGDATAMSALMCHSASIHSWVRKASVNLYRQLAKRSAELHLELVKRSERGDPIADSRIGFMSYQRLFDGLASGSLPLAADVAGRILSRTTKIPDPVSAFDRSFCQALCAFVFQSPDRAIQLEKFKPMLESSATKPFAGYGAAFEAMLNSDRESLNRAILDIAEGHIKLGKTGVWKETVDRELCVWGIGIAQLAKSYNLDADIDHVLIPGALIRP
ncbi:MAG: hypothetical protein QM783_07295 [Phycisphaerales bacterium]